MNMSENPKLKLYVESKKVPIRVVDFSLDGRKLPNPVNYPEIIRSGLVRLPESYVQYEYILDKKQEQIKAFALETAKNLNADLEVVDISRENGVVRLLGRIFNRRVTPALVIDSEALVRASRTESHDQQKSKQLVHHRPLIVSSPILKNEK